MVVRTLYVITWPQYKRCNILAVLIPLMALMVELCFQVYKVAVTATMEEVRKKCAAVGLKLHSAFLFFYLSVTEDLLLLCSLPRKIKSFNVRKTKVLLVTR